MFSDNALIIVGNVVKTSKETGRVSADSRVSYALHTKRDYLARLTKVFAANRQVDVRFSDFHIMRSKHSRRPMPSSSAQALYIRASCRTSSSTVSRMP